MTTAHRPQLPLPPPLRGSEHDSFAYHSIVDRLPRIGERVLETNRFSPEVVARLKGLMAEIPDGPIRLLQDAAAPDMEAWITYVTPYLDCDWLEVPWFFVELYFYRRILEATGYFVAGPGNDRDPFATQKQESLENSQEQVAALATRQERLREGGWADNAMPDLLATALWGNQGDLSMWPAGAEAPSGQGDRDAYLLADDRERVTHYLAQGDDGEIRVDFLMDNAGFELVSDLALVDYLLDEGVADVVYLHLKAFPVFVSDALIEDVRQTVETLATAKSPAAAAWGKRLQAFLAQGQLRLTRHRFWNSPQPAWEMPPELRQTLGSSTLIVSKGDANYRRLLGDRHWAFTTPFAQIVSYLPASLLALRTLKSDVAAGIEAERVAALAAEGVAWTTSGQYGVIQFAPRARPAATDS